MPTNHAEFYRGLEPASEALQTLKRAEDTSAATRAKAVHDGIQPLLDTTPESAQLACKRGCSHCCHYPVGITFAEAMRLARFASKRPELRRRIHDADTATSKLSWEELVGMPCPLLVDDACAAHDDRPMPCRALGSLDAQACEQALTTNDAPPRDETAWWRGLGAAHALASLNPSGSRELRSALNAALSQPESPEAGFRSARVAPGS